jgi:hypothetical protein
MTLHTSLTMVCAQLVYDFGYHACLLSHTLCPAPVLQDDTNDWSNLDLSDPENWSSVSFKMHVHAYSGIGPGATFCVDLCSGTVEPADESAEESGNEEDLGDEEAEDSGDEDFEDMDDIARHRWGLMSDGDDFESGDVSDDDEDVMEEVVELEEREGAWNEDPEKPFRKTPAYYDMA